jgi:hypothetical protein
MPHNEKNLNQEKISLSSRIIELREHIGTLPELAIPNQQQIEAAVEAKFPDLPINEKSKLVEAFLLSEQAAAEEADRLLEAV